MHAQRIYNDRKWPNPVVLKMTGVEPAMTPPAVTLRSVTWKAGVAVLEAEITDMGKAEAVEAGFEYRNVKGLDLTERPDAYTATATVRRTGTGIYRIEVKGWQPGDVMEVRAAVKHPLITTYSREARHTIRP
jgi:alpha-L-fucosidase